MVEGPSTLSLLVRLAFSLAVIVGLLLVFAKVARRNGGILHLPGLGRARDTLITVVERHPLTRNASVAVVHVGGRTMVVGITEHTVSLLSESAIGPPDVIDLDAEGAGVGAGHEVTERSPTGSPLEAGWTLPLDPGRATDVADDPGHPPRMSFVEALRELTVRKKA